ncbi:hypothetical protein N0A02_33090 (plasmid) [Paraburkholderia acidicola]
MKNLALVFAIGGLFFGVAAAAYWQKSTKVPIDPLNGDPDGVMSGDPEGQQFAWLAAQLRANQEVGRLNKIAARLTAVAVVLSALSTVLGLEC